MSFLNSQGRGRAAGEIKGNAVLEQQERLAAEFRSENAGASAGGTRATGPFARVLCELLSSIGWEGPQHRISEALPYLSSIGSVRMLRAVLARLDVDLIPTD